MQLPNLPCWGDAQGTLCQLFGKCLCVESVLVVRKSKQIQLCFELTRDFLLICQIGGSVKRYEGGKEQEETSQNTVLNRHIRNIIIIIFLKSLKGAICWLGKAPILSLSSSSNSTVQSCSIPCPRGL